MDWYFVGVDFGQSKDPTAIAVLERAETTGEWDDDYLQFLIELGAAGFAIGLALMGSIVARTWRAASREAEPESRYLAIGCIGAMAAIGLHSVVDFNLYVPANAMLLAWICGVALSIGPGRGARDWRGGGLPVTIEVTAVRGGRALGAGAPGGSGTR